MNDLKFFAGSSNRPLAEKICQQLGVPLGDVQIERFSNGEIEVKFGENVRRKRVYVFQTCAEPVNDHFMELILMLDALKRASVAEITVIMPLFFYSRQDRKVEPRVPISAKMVADLICAAGGKKLERIVTMDLHSNPIQGFFDISVDNLYGSPIFLKYIMENETLREGNLVVVAPDGGATPRAIAYAKQLDVDIAQIYKKRGEDGNIKSMHLSGDVKGKIAVIPDDMVDTGGTLTKACELLLSERHGALQVFAFATHAILSETPEKSASRKIEESLLSGVVTTDTIPLKDGFTYDKVTQLSTAWLFAEAIKRTHRGDPISDLFSIEF